MELFLKLWIGFCLQGEVCKHNKDCFEDISRFHIALQLFQNEKPYYFPYKSQDDKDCGETIVEYINNPQYKVTCSEEAITIMRLYE